MIQSWLNNLECIDLVQLFWCNLLSAFNNYTQKYPKIPYSLENFSKWPGMFMGVNLLCSFTKGYKDDPASVQNVGDFTRVLG